jgi:hypothetical protein
MCVALSLAKTAISDMQVYNYIKKSFKARNLDDELKKLSGLNSKEVFARLKATHIFSKETLKIPINFFAFFIVMLFVKATKDFRCKVDFPGNETCFF